MVRSIKNSDISVKTLDLELSAVKYFIESVVYMGEQNLVYYAGCQVDPIEWVFQAGLYVPPFHQSRKTC